MVLSLVLVVALGALVFAGYRFNLYLYSLGAVGYRKNRQDATSDTEPAAIDELPLKVAERMAKRERDAGLRVARMGFLFLLIFIVLFLVVSLSALVH